MQGMEDDMITEIEVYKILSKKFLLPIEKVKNDSKICAHLGICGGDFQDFLMFINEKLNLGLSYPCHVPFSEDNVTIGRVIEWADGLRLQ
jgi:hypothetical protein